jgi:predicted alpha/beta hydrolase family esterase
MTPLIIPGLRDHVAEHWQTLLAARLPQAVSLVPMGRSDLDCAARVAAIEAAVSAISGPVALVAHSGGCIMVAHWVRQTRHAGRIHAALLATPPDFERPLPAGYPTPGALRDGGWLPVPRAPLPFPTLVVTSRNDPLGDAARVTALARDWGAACLDAGAVGHLNPASGFGPWPLAEELIAALSRTPPALPRIEAARHAPA